MQGSSWAWFCASGPIWLDYHPWKQLAHILNIDKTCLVLDGSEGGKSGPEVYFYGRTLPELVRAAAKSSLSTTMIGGNTAAGETIPPHFQLSTSAHISDNMQLQNKLIKYISSVLGKFGCQEGKEWPFTFGMVEKWGMDGVEFDKYIMGSIVPFSGCGRCGREKSDGEGGQWSRLPQPPITGLTAAVGNYAVSWGPQHHCGDTGDQQELQSFQSCVHW